MKTISAANDSRVLAQLLLGAKWQVLAAGMIGVVLTFLASTSLPLRYEAAGLLVATAPDDAGKQANDLPTDIDILRSRALLASVARRLDLGRSPSLVPTPRNPLAHVRTLLSDVAGSAGSSQTSRLPGNSDAAAVEFLLANVKISGNENSRALTVAFDAGTPQVAADVVNEVMEQYIAQEGAAKDAEALKASADLESRAAFIRKQADADDQLIQQFQNTHDVLTLEAGSTATLQLSIKQDELASAKQELIQAQAALSSNPDLSGGERTSPSHHVSASRELQASPVMQALNERETDVLQQLAQARNIGSRNPKRLDLENSLRSVRAQIAAETGRVSDTLVRDLQAATQRVAILTEAVDQAQTAARRSSTAQLALSGLTRDADSKRALYQTLLARAEDTRLGIGQPTSARIISLAVPPGRPLPSRTPVIMALGLIGGMLFAALLIVLRHLISIKVPSPDILERATGLMSLGSLPFITRHERAGMVELAVAQQHSPLAETLRGLRLAVQNINASSPCKIVLVTSAERGEGKSSVAAGLARRAAGDGLRVLLIEADMHRPSLARYLAVGSATSLEAVLLGFEADHKRLAIDAPSGMHCLLSRGGQTNPFALLASERFGSLVTFARHAYDLVVIDSPPVLRVSDPVLLSRWADLILFAVRAEKTPLSLVTEAIQRFPERARSRIATVLTCARYSHGAYGGYHDVRTDQVAGQPEASKEGSPNITMIPERDGLGSTAC